MIGLGEFIEQWGNLGALGVMCITVATLLIYVVIAIVRMLKKELKDLYKNSERNILLNTKSAMILSQVSSHQASLNDAVRNTLMLSNGNNPEIRKILARLDKMEKKT